MSTGTAAFAGLGQKGLLRAGADADLVAFDPDAQARVDVGALAHKNKVSAYDGRVLRGAVAATWVGGVAVTASTQALVGRLRPARTSDVLGEPLRGATHGGARTEEACSGNVSSV
ncbi:hypothetical protein [Rathayibacter oskolensis]|uniref:hypothetical protein n=1 Tax=Rathayibacter oskolensis TaxID=1891671 RepID=UPI0034663A46